MSFVSNIQEPLTESEEDGKLTSGRFVDIFHGAQKGHKSRPPADTDSFPNISKFCIARGLLDVVGEGPTDVASLKGLVVPKDCVEVTLYAIKDEDDYILRMLSHHAEGIKLLKKKMGKEAKIKDEDLAHDESSIVPAVKNKPTVWLVPTHCFTIFFYLRVCVVLRKTHRPRFGRAVPSPWTDRSRRLYSAGSPQNM